MQTSLSTSFQHITSSQFDGKSDEPGGALGGVKDKTDVEAALEPASDAA